MIQIFFYKFDLSWNIFLFCLVLRLRGTILALPRMVQSKNVFHKILNLSITNNEKV